MSEPIFSNVLLLEIIITVEIIHVTCILFQNDGKGMMIVS